jgi:hypothetical protein
MPRGRTWLLVLWGTLGSGCTVLLSFSEDPESDATAGDAPAVPDVLPRPPDAGDDAAPDATPDAAPCLGGAAAVTGANGHCYLVFDDVTTWDAARAACAALGATTHLVTFGAAEENAALVASLGLAHRWTGFTDATTEGDWLWFNGEATTYTNWRTGEPNNGGGAGENCGVIEGNNGGVWDDRPCGLTYGRVCERD